MNTPKQIIVTGGAGFIGSAFVWKLNLEGEKDIIVVDKAGADQKFGNLNGRHYTDYIDKTDFIKSIISNKFASDVKAVFHIGACSSTTEQNAAYLKENNFEYSKHLAEWSLKHGVPFFYASSAATYGNGSRGYSDEDAAIPSLSPLNLYGRSKQDFDLYLLENGLTNKVVGWKYFNVFGPNESHKEDMRSMVVKGYEQIKQSGRIRLFKSYHPEYLDGEQKRDFVYIKDTVDLMWEFYRNRSIKGIYNIGTGTARSWNDLVKAIFAALGLQPNIEYIEMPEILRDKYQYFTQADLAKLKRTGLRLNFTTLESAIADHVKNYLEPGRRL